MNHEEKIYIESHIERLVSMTVEAGYNVDRLGNIIYKDKSKTIEQLRKVLDDVVVNTNLDVEEIIDYLLEIYNGKINESNFAQEYKEINNILASIKNLPEDDEKEIDVNKSNNPIDIEKTR